MSDPRPKVGIVILPYDNVEFFVRAVNSVLQNTGYPIERFVASHNPCKDGQVNSQIHEFMDAIKRQYPNFDFVINDENLYHGKGTMVGVKILPECEYVVLLNDDIFIPGRELLWLEKMINFMEKNPNVATLTPSLYHLRETIYWVGKQDPLSGTHDFLHLPKGDPRIPTKPLETCYNNFSLCLIRKNLLDEFPLGQTCNHYGSDSEFCNRVKEAYPEMIHMVMPSVKLYHENIYALRTNRNDPKTDG
jgi:GT2 family glycosyltransferase